MRLVCSALLILRNRLLLLLLLQSRLRLVLAAERVLLLLRRLWLLLGGCLRTQLLANCPVASSQSRQPPQGTPQGGTRATEPQALQDARHLLQLLLSLLLLLLWRCWMLWRLLLWRLLWGICAGQLSEVLCELQRRIALLLLLLRLWHTTTNRPVCSQCCLACCCIARVLSSTAHWCSLCGCKPRILGCCWCGCIAGVLGHPGVL